MTKIVPFSGQNLVPKPSHEMEAKQEGAAGGQSQVNGRVKKRPSRGRRGLKTEQQQRQRYLRREQDERDG